MKNYSCPKCGKTPTVTNEDVHTCIKCYDCNIIVKNTGFFGAVFKWKRLCRVFRKKFIKCELLTCALNTQGRCCSTNRIPCKSVPRQFQD